MKTRIISMLLAVLMVITAVPAMTVFSFAEEAQATQATAEDYNALYAQQDKLIIGVDFFTSTVPETQEKLTSTEIKEFFYVGTAGNFNANYPNIYNGNGALSLESDATAKTGGTIGWSTSNELHDTNRSLTYQYVFSVDTEANISQALSSTMARINLSYNSATGKIYPSSLGMDTKDSDGTRKFQNASFTEGSFGSLSSVGESMSVTHNTEIVTNNNASLEDFTGGNVSGKLYVNDSCVSYDLPLSYTVDGVEKNLKINGAYSSVGTGTNTTDAKVSLYAIRVYTTSLTEMEIMQNNLVDIAKFYEIDIEKVKNILSLDAEIQKNVLKSLYSLKLTREKSNTEAAAELEALIEEGLKDYYYGQMYVTDGLVAHFSAKDFIETYGSASKGATTTDSKENSIKWLEAATAAEDGKSVIGAFSYASILADTSKKDSVKPYLNHTVDMVIRPTAAESNVYSSGFDKLNTVANGTNLSFRHDFSSWRLNQYEGGNTPGIGMYANTGLKVYVAENTLLPMGKIFNLTVLTQTTEHEAYYSELKSVDNYKDAVIHSTFSATFYGPVGNKFYASYDEYSAAATNASVEVLSQEKAAVIVGDASYGFEEYKFDGYYHSEFLANGYPFQSKYFSFVYNSNTSISRGDIGDNNGTQVIVGGTTVSTYRASVYNRILTEAERVQNHTADMYIYYDLPAGEYSLLSNENKAFVDEKVAEWEFDSFTADTTAEIEALAKAEFDKYIAWANLDYSAYDEMPARYKQYVKAAIEAISYDDYASESDPAAAAQADIDALVDAYNFDLSQYNRLSADYKLKIDALVAEFDIDELLASDDVKAAAQAAFDNAVKTVVNDYNSLYVANGLIAHFDAKTYVDKYDAATDGYKDLANATVDFNADTSYAEGTNYIAGAQLAYFSAIPTVDGKIVAPYTLEALVSPTTNSAFIESGLSKFVSYDTTAEQFKVRHNLATWRFSTAYQSSSKWMDASISQEMFLELGTQAKGIGANSLDTVTPFTFTHRLDELVVSTVISENGTYKFFDDNDIYYHSEMTSSKWTDTSETGSASYLVGKYYHSDTKTLNGYVGDDGVAITLPTEVGFDGYLKYSIITDANRISGAGAEADTTYGTGGASFVYPTTTNSSGVISYTNKAVIRIGNSGGDADFKIYDVRVYDRALTDDEVKQNHFVDLLKYYEVDLFDYVRLEDAQKAEIINTLGAYSISETNAEEIETLLAKAAKSSADYSVTDGLIAYFDAEQYIAEYGTPTSTTGYTDALGKAINWYSAVGKNENNKDIYANVDENGRYVLGMFYYSGILDDPEADGVNPYSNHTVDMLIKPTAVATNVINTGFDKINIAAVGETLKLRHDYASWRIANVGSAPYINMYANTGLAVSDADGASIPSGEVFNFAIRTQITELEVKETEIKEKYPSGTKYQGALSTNYAYGPYNGTYYHTYASYAEAAGDAALAEEDAKILYSELDQYKFDGYYYSDFIANGYPFQSGHFSMAYVSNTTAEAGYPGRNYGTNVMVGGSTFEVYRVRVYSKALTDEELAQNHFSDVAYYYGMDVIGFDKLPEVYRTQIIDAFKTVTFDNTYTLEELQTMYDSLAYPEVEGESLAGTEDIVNFEGYSTRQSSFAGIRATFSYDPQEIKALEEEGYSVEMGVIMAIAKEGRTPDDLTLINNGEKFVAAGSQMLASSVYKDGVAVGNITEIEYPDPYNPQRTHQFVYAITYQAASSQTAAMYALDCMYRAFLIATKDGISYITYYDCESGLFGDEISIYDLSTYWMYEKDLDNSIIKGVISTAGYTDDVKELYEKYASAKAKVDAEGIMSLSFNELNALYNVNLKAEKDELLARKLKYYEIGGEASDVNGNVDVCANIDAMITEYEKAHGVPIRDSLYEITGATGTVYFDVTTDKDPYTYTLGDSVTFNVNLRDKETKNLVTCDAVSYSYTIDGVSGTKSGTASASEGSFSFTVPASEISASSLAGEGIIVRAKATAVNVASQEVFEGGAVIDWQKISSAAAKPEDFETFWAAQLAAAKLVNPTDTTVTEYTGTGVLISDIKRTEDADGKSTYSTESGNTISEDNYFHVIKVDADRLAYLQTKGLQTNIGDTHLANYDIYEVYLKAPGANPTTGMLSIPKNPNTETQIVLTFAGYGPHAPSINAYGNDIRFQVTHHGYWTDANDTELYSPLFDNSGILSGYGKSNGSVNGSYTDKADNYMLYLFLRNVQALRFVTDVPADTSDITDESLKAIYDGINKAASVTGGTPVYLTGSSMGGYQSIGVSALAEMLDITIAHTQADIPAFCNLAGNSVDGRLDDIFGIGYEENMNYFDPVFFAEYVASDFTVGRCGLGDYTCPPSGIIATYNAIKSNKTMTFYQNSTHSYKLDEDIYKFAVSAESQLAE